MEELLEQPLEIADRATMFQYVFEYIQDHPTPEESTALAIQLSNLMYDLTKTDALDFVFVGALAMRIGALIEHQADPAALHPVFTITLKHFLEQFYLSWNIYCRSGDHPQLEGMDERLINEIQNELSNAGSDLELATAAFLSRCPEARQSFREREDFMWNIRSLRWQYGFLHKITHVLDQEELVVLHVGDNWGFRIQCSGISDNYQLQALLMHACGELFPEHYPVLHPQVLACYQGEGPQGLNASFQPPWRTRQWTAVSEEGNLDEHTCHYIWGSGVPADILHCPALDNIRVILLDSPPGGGMEVVRDFEGLKARLTVLEQLDTDTCEQMIQVLIAVPNEQKIAALRQYEQDNFHSVF